MSGDMPGGFRARTHRGWSQCFASRAGTASRAGAAGLLVIAGCAGGSPAAQGPPAKVTIVSGNLTFSSSTAGEHPAAGLPHRSPDRAAPGQGTSHQRAGDAIVTGLSGPGTRDTASGSVSRARAAQAANGRSRASQGTSAPVDLRPDLGIRVAVRDGTLTRVSVRTRTGKTAAGTYARGSHGWRTRWALAPSQTYQVTAMAVDARGERTVMASTFRTLRPGRTFTGSTTLGAGQTVGVGMPIMIDFSRPVTDKAAVERALHIWSSKPVTGAWYWVSSKSVWFRPRHYWPAHTRVRFTAHLAGLQGAPGVYGQADLTQHFRIGDSLIAVASAATHHMKVWWNGRLAGDLAGQHRAPRDGHPGRAVPVLRHGQPGGHELGQLWRGPRDARLLQRAGLRRRPVHVQR